MHFLSGGISTSQPDLLLNFVLGCALGGAVNKK
jgi:hypothetical protein